MHSVARLARRSSSGTLAALALSLVALLLWQTDATAQRALIDPQGVSLKVADLPRGFSVVESQTASEPLRLGQSQADSDIVGVTFRTVMERSRSLENLQSGPVKVSQMISRSNDPSRATFSLDAQREYNLRENGYEAATPSTPDDELLCLVRHDGPFIEYRIDAVKNGDTLVSTTTSGLPSAIDLDGAVALARVSLGRYDEQMSTIAAAQPLRATTADDRNAGVRSLATATPTPAPPLPTPTPGAPATSPPAATPAPAPTPSQLASTAAPAPQAKLPPHFDSRLAQPWSELMSSTATTKSGEKVPAYLRQIAEKADIKVMIGDLSPNVGGELRSVASMDGDRAKIIESAITINDGVMNESPRVLAAMLAHEIVHANQSMSQSGKKTTDCLADEVEAYAVQARVWSAFWGPAQRPDQTTWERTNNELESVWKDSGEDGLRTLIRDETDTDAHSCVQ